MRACLQINEGKVVEAEGLLCRILETAPPHAKLGAYVARGTARALSRDLQRESAPATDTVDLHAFLVHACKPHSSKGTVNACLVLEIVSSRQNALQPLWTTSARRSRWSRGMPTAGSAAGRRALRWGRTRRPCRCAFERDCADGAS